MRKSGRVAIFCASLYAGILAPAAHAAMVPPSGALDFTVLRGGEEVGEHHIAFNRKGDELDVDIKTRIKVKMAFVTVYRFEHDGHEVWRDDKLASMKTDTDDDGAHHALAVVATASGNLNITGDGKESTVKGDLIPASLWNSAFLKSKEILNSLVGTELAIKVAFKGEEDIPVNGKTVRALHYSMTGDFERDIWYDDDQVLVKIAFKGQDGSDIQYVLR